MPSERRRSGPLALLTIVLALIALGLGAALYVEIRVAKDGTQASLQPTVTALKTQVAQQQRQIARLQQTVTAQPTPSPQPSASRGYLMTLQIDKYSYVLYLEWTESNGFLRDGRLLTTDNYARNASKAFQLTGTNNSGSYGFSGRDQGTTFSFTGKVSADRTLTINGVPWSVFSGFVGGTFSQTLHPAARQDYDAAASAMPGPPS